MKRPSLLHFSVLLALAIAGCKSPRPTEFVNIVFTPSVETDHYATWNFELESCVNVDDPRVDRDLVHRQLLAAIRNEIEGYGYTYQAIGTPDFRVYYELQLKGSTETAERAHGRITIRDVATGRLVWRGERKRPVDGRAEGEEQQIDQIELFAHELLRYTHKLDQTPE